MSKTVTITLQNPDTTPIVGAKVYFKLAQNAVASGSAQIGSTTVVATTDSGGVATIKLWCSDELTPANLAYTVSAVAPGGGTVYGPVRFVIAGSSPISLNSTAPGVGGGVVSANAVITNPSAQQTINGQNLVLEGANLGLSGAGSTTGDAWVNRPAAGVVGIGTTSGATDGTLKAATVNATTGFQVNGVALAASNLSNGVTGSGAVVLATSPTLTTPNIGAATGTSLNLGSGTLTATHLTASSTTLDINVGSQLALYLSTVMRYSSTYLIGWSSNVSPGAASLDLSLARGGPGILQVNNGESAGAGGTIKAAVGAFGATPAQSGEVRVPNGGGIYARNTTNTADFPIARCNAAANTASFGFNGEITTSGSVTISTAGGQFAVSGCTNIVVDSSGINSTRIKPRVVTAADATSITPTSDTADITIQTNTQIAGTLTINAPTGTPTDGQKLQIRIKTTNAQTYSFNATYRFSTSVTAPTTLAAGKSDYLGFQWNATDSKWDCLAVSQGY